MTEPVAPSPPPRIHLNGYAWAAAVLGVLALGLVIATLVFKDSLVMKGPPALGRGLRYFGTEQVTERAKAAFPVGSEVSRMTGLLRTNRFAVDEAAHTARYDWSNGVCTLIVDLAWKADAAAKVADVTASYHKGECR